MNPLKVINSYLNEKKVKIAVTGLSRSGKTVFITSLLDQLQYTHKIQSITSGEFTIKLLPPKNDYQRFSYDEYIKLINSTFAHKPKLFLSVSA